jgi:hypothetical protein
LANTPQTTATNQATQGLALGTQLMSLVDQIENFMVAYTAAQPDGQWQQMATAALNADGSLGATDQSPVEAHPIIVANLNKSRAQLITLINAFEQLQAFFGGQAVTAAAYGQSIRQATL